MELSESSYHVLFSTDRETDCRYLAVVGRSLAENFHQPEALRFHLIYTTICEENIQRLKKSWEDLPLEFSHYRIDELVGDFMDKPGFGFWRWLWFEDVLPAQMERLLYLDCDMIVYDDVSPLWSIDFHDKAAAAVIDPARDFLGFHRELAPIATQAGSTFSSDDHYFNSGFWFINVPEWRKYRVRENAHAMFGGHFEIGTYYDQSALNIILREKILPLSSSWNLIEPLYLWESWNETIYQDYGRGSPHPQPKIRHFAGYPKPDGLLVRGSDERLFYHYLAKTEWEDTVSEVSKKWWKPYLGELLDFHYLVLRGFKQKAVPGYRKDLKTMLYRSPYLPLLYLALLSALTLKKTMRLIMKRLRQPRH